MLQSKILTNSLKIKILIFISLYNLNVSPIPHLFLTYNACMKTMCQYSFLHTSLLVGNNDIQEQRDKDWI